MESDTLSAGDFGAFREKLLAHRRVLAGDVSQLANEVKASASTSVRGELADAGQDAAEHDFSLSRMASEEDEIYQIDEALKKIEEGTYGRCEECDRPINSERLEALPHARLCIECQRVFEAGQAALGSG